MTMALSPEARDRLAKLCGLLASEHDGERATAAAMATALLRKHGLTWREIIHGPAAPRPGPDVVPWCADVELCLRNSQLMTAWENEFVGGLSRFPRLSAKQRACLGQIVKRLRAEGAR